MSFLYPRVIAISRPLVQSGVGAVGYGGLASSGETTIASGISASIQQKKDVSKPDAGLPGDIAKRTLWLVMIPLNAVAKGVIKDRDIVTDDENIRYQVTAAYWNSLGYKVLAERLEA